jgi:hypothetical protein
MEYDFETLVVTVTRNKLAIAREAIPQLKQLTRRPFHYSIVANGDLETGQWLLENQTRGWYDSVNVLSDNIGVGPAYNLPWRHFIRFNKRLQYYVKFDDSNIPTRKDWLDELIRISDYFRGKAGMVAHLIADNDHVWPIQTIEGWSVRPTPLNCSGSCCLISRNIWEAVGLWDEEVVGWLGPNRDDGPFYYSREDGMMGKLCMLAGLVNMYHPDLNVIRCIGERNERPEYIAWKKEQYQKALPHQQRLIRDYMQRLRTFPHRPCY